MLTASIAATSALNPWDNVEMYAGSGLSSHFCEIAFKQEASWQLNANSHVSTVSTVLVSTKYRLEDLILLNVFNML